MSTSPTFAPEESWRAHLIHDDDDIARLLERTRRIAVLGIKTAETRQPAYYVPEYTQHAGYEVVPVPVYYPEVTEILGQPVYRTITAISPPVDMVNVFRRAKDIPDTLTTSSRHGPRRCGSSSAFATTRRQSGWRGRGSTSCRIAACWWNCRTSGSERAHLHGPQRTTSTPCTRSTCHHRGASSLSAAGNDSVRPDVIRTRTSRASLSSG